MTKPKVKPPVRKPGRVVFSSPNRTSILVSDVDYARLSTFKWFIDKKTGYAHRTLHHRHGKNRYESIPIQMHTDVIGKPPIGMLVDHVNRNRLDNRRDNLRFVTPSESVQNTQRLRMYAKGVSRCSCGCKKRRWLARIKKGGVTYNLGRFDDMRDAMEAYNSKARELYGKNAQKSSC